MTHEWQNENRECTQDPIMPHPESNIGSYQVNIALDYLSTLKTLARYK
jgi:hypothetical protein